VGSEVAVIDNGVKWLVVSRLSLSQCVHQWGVWITSHNGDHRESGENVEGTPNEMTFLT
jgi:hypothetical protein